MTKLRYIVTLIALLTCFGNKALAQSQREKVEELRATFIAKKMEFSSNESEKFWPIYNEYHDKLKLIRRNLRMAYRNLPANYTDKDAEELIALENKSKLAEAELNKTYNEKLKAVIGPKKVVKLQLVEEEFKREVINTIKEK